MDDGSFNSAGMPLFNQGFCNQLRWFSRSDKLLQAPASYEPWSALTKEVPVSAMAGHAGSVLLRSKEGVQT
jgi:hypothetical protein